MSNATRFSGFEAIRRAMEVEKEGHKFYTKASQATSNLQLKDLFLQLADDEVQHLNTLRTLIINYQDGAYWENEQDYLAYLKHFNERDVFPSNDEVDSILAKENAVAEILDLAIQAERNFAEYFSVAARHALTDDGRKAFIWLANEEKQHMELLLKRKKTIFEYNIDMP